MIIQIPSPRCGCGRATAGGAGRGCAHSAPFHAAPAPCFALLCTSQALFGLLKAAKPLGGLRGAATQRLYREVLGIDLPVVRREQRAPCRPLHARVERGIQRITAPP